MKKKHKKKIRRRWRRWRRSTKHTSKLVSRIFGNATLFLLLLLISFSFCFDFKQHKTTKTQRWTWETLTLGLLHSNWGNAAQAETAQTVAKKKWMLLATVGLCGCQAKRCREWEKCREWKRVGIAEDRVRDRGRERVREARNNQWSWMPDKPKLSWVSRLISQSFLRLCYSSWYCTPVPFLTLFLSLFGAGLQRKLHH